MAYILWGIVNISLFIFFITVCVRATKFLREKAGFFASAIFVFGLLSFMVPRNNTNNTGINSGLAKTWTFIPADNIMPAETYSVYTHLEKTLVSTYTLNISYYKNKEGQVKNAISASSATTGLIMGTRWMPMSVNVNTKEKNNLEYVVRGFVEWNLLGATIYSQAKEFKGFVKAE